MEGELILEEDQEEVLDMDGYDDDIEDSDEGF
jgi:hypothetical protein